jgi:hypothetical protein
MSSNTRTTRIVPIALGVAMVAIIVAAGLAPNTGAIPATSNCQYGSCPANTAFPWWAIAAIVIVVVAALAAALVLLRRRRPPTAAAPPPSGSTGPTPGATGAPPPPPPAAAPAYLETPEDVGRGLPSVAPKPSPTVPPTAVAAAGGAGAAGAAAGAEGEPDIDSLMAELDKISGEILKRPKSPADKKPPTDD